MTERLIAGAKVGDYQLVRPVGLGGFGQVWLAEDRHGARVAVKVLQHADGTSPDPSLRSWFQREYRTGSRVDSRFVATPIDADMDAEPAWIAFRYIEGRTLRRILDHEPLTPDQVARIAAQILRGLTELHHAGLVHRDIKPENIMISPGDQVTILDLGIVHDPTATKVTRDVKFGTPGYLAPEAWQGVSMGPAMDMWAFAVTVSDMFCPDRRHTGAHPVEAVRPLHPGWADILTACLSTEPNNRPAASAVMAWMKDDCRPLDQVLTSARDAEEHDIEHTRRLLQMAADLGNAEAVANLARLAAQVPGAASRTGEQPVVSRAADIASAENPGTHHDPEVPPGPAVLLAGPTGAAVSAEPPRPSDPQVAEASAPTPVTGSAAHDGGAHPTETPPQPKPASQPTPPGSAGSVLITPKDAPQGAPRAPLPPQLRETGTPPLQPPASAGMPGAEHAARLKTGLDRADRQRRRSPLKTLALALVAGTAVAVVPLGALASKLNTDADQNVATPTPQPSPKTQPRPPAPPVTPWQAAKDALPALKKGHPKHQFSALVKNGEEPWLISINKATVTEWRWEDKKRRWDHVQWEPMSRFRFTDIIQEDVTDDGRKDFILPARDATGGTVGSVVVNNRSEADWARMRGLDAATHGAAHNLRLSGQNLISDYTRHGTVSSVGRHGRTAWRYKGYQDGYPLFAEVPL